MNSQLHRSNDQSHVGPKTKKAFNVLNMLSEAQQKHQGIGSRAAAILNADLSAAVLGKASSTMMQRGFATLMDTRIRASQEGAPIVTTALNRSLVEDRQAMTAGSSKSEEHRRHSLGGNPKKRRASTKQGIQLDSIDHVKQMAKLQGIIEKTDKALMDNSNQTIMPRSHTSISQLEPVMEPKILSQPQLRSQSNSTMQNQSSGMDLKSHLFMRRKKTHAAEASYLFNPKLDSLQPLVQEASLIEANPRHSLKPLIKPQRQINALYQPTIPHKSSENKENSHAENRASLIVKKKAQSARTNQRIASKIKQAMEVKRESSKPRKAEETKAETKVEVTKGSGGKSKWMAELARQNYQYFIEKLKVQEGKRRINIIRAIKSQLTHRFMKLYRYFRLKKYGEALPIDLSAPATELIPSPSDFVPAAETNSDFEILSKEELEILRQAKISITRKLRGASTRFNLKRRGSQLNQDLGTVIEEESMADSDILQRSQLKQFEGFNPHEYLEEKLEGAIYEEVIMMADKIMKIKAFLQMIITRRRYIKMLEASKAIKKCLRKYVQVKKTKADAKKQRDVAYIMLLESKILRKTPREVLNQAATKIQTLLFNKIKVRNEVKDLRQKLSSLPFICRSSYVKVYFLKRSTGRLMNDVTHSLLKY